MSDDEDNGLLNIQLSDAEDNNQKQSKRTGQSEADFQAVKCGYQAKVENGEIYKTIILPLGPSVNKQRLQQVLHAVEELYFFRRFHDAIEFVTRVFEAKDGAEGLDEETHQLLFMYESRCKKNISDEAPKE